MEQRQLSRMWTHRIKARENCYCEPAFLSEKRVNCVFFHIFDEASTFLYNAAVSNNRNCLHVLPRDILLRAINVKLARGIYPTGDYWFRSSSTIPTHQKSPD